MVLAHIYFLVFIGVVFYNTKYPTISTYLMFLANKECPPLLPEHMIYFVEDNNKFAMDMYKHIKETEKGNIVYSPMSISMALGMVMGGAKGKTLEQIKNVLAKRLAVEEIGPAYLECMDTINMVPKDTKISMYIANVLYVQKGMAMLPEFSDHVQMCMSGEAMERDFTTKSDEIRVEVNKYVSNKTHEMIKDLLPKDSIGDKTRMILVNTMYLKVAWKSPFEESNTKKETFHSNDGDQMVDFMRQQDNYNFMEDDNIQVLQMDMMKKMEPHTVTVKIPKFKVKMRMEPKKILMKMGMTDMFSPGKCNLSGISDAELFVSDVFHQAVVEANEIGTEASAATAIIAKGRMSFIPKYRKATFTADRPFMFMIYHHQAMSVLFMGNVLTFK